MTGTEDFLRQLYDRFSARDIDAVLAMLDPDVAWANGMDGGHVHGHDGVRAYWTRQWATIDPHVEPLGFTATADGTTVVEVQQTVRDLDGKVLSEKRVGHVFRLGDGKVRRFDIADA